MNYRSKRALYVTRATLYCQSKDRLLTCTAPAKLKVVCDCLAELHPELELRKNNRRVAKWDWLFYACDLIGVNVERIASPVTTGRTLVKEKKKPKTLVYVPESAYAPKVNPPVDFYYSREWRELRYRALKVHGNRCQCCGATPKTTKQIHVDHIKPRSKFPELELDFANLQVLCDDCNIGKSNKDDTDWRPPVHP
jgi:5-methylcytosine-specific restriction endonuclease McrA